MEKLRSMFLPAFTIALLGALISYSVLTLIVAGTFIEQIFPIVCVVLYAVMSFVLDKVPYVKERIWMKPLIMVAVAVVLVLLLVLL